MGDKLRNICLRWFGHVQCRPPKVSGRKGFSLQVNGPSRERVRLKRTSMEVVRLDLKKCNLSEDLAKDRLEW